MRHIRVFTTTATATTNAGSAIVPDRTEFVIIFVAKVRYLGISGVACCSGYFIVEFLSASTANAVGDESDEDGENNETDNGEYACNSACVMEESRKGNELKEVKDAWRECG